MKIICTLLLLSTALLIAYGLVSPRPFGEDIRCIIAGIVFSGALIGRCILEASARLTDSRP